MYVYAAESLHRKWYTGAEHINQFRALHELFGQTFFDVCLFFFLLLFMKLIYNEKAE